MLRAAFRSTAEPCHFSRAKEAIRVAHILARAIFAGMSTKVKKRTAKSKLTLSVRTKYVAMLRRASARKGKSITEMVEEFAEQVEREAKGDKSELSDFVKRNLGILKDKVKPSDWDRDDRFGDILRKHVPR